MPRRHIIVVKVIRPFMPGMPWRIVDETGEIDETIVPNAWLREVVGGRPSCYLRAVRSIDRDVGWTFTGRWKGNQLYW